MEAVHIVGQADANQSLPRRRQILFRSVELVDFDDLHGDAVTRRLAELAAITIDVSEGVEVILAMVERDAVDEGCCDDRGDPAPALLGPTQHSMLERLCRASLSLLAREADRSLMQTIEAKRCTASR